MQGSIGFRRWLDIKKLFLPVKLLLLHQRKKSVSDPAAGRTEWSSQKEGRIYHNKCQNVQQANKCSWIKLQYRLLFYKVCEVRSRNNVGINLNYGDMDMEWKRLLAIPN